MKRSTRQDLANQTVEIVDRGGYVLADGRWIDLKHLIEPCLKGTRFFAPEDLGLLRSEVLSAGAPFRTTEIEVSNETTLEGIARLRAKSQEPIAALNFASAKNPGGGFLNGSQAQEESLARSSALYASLLRAPEYYDRHRSLSSCLYTHAMILSPNCPIFRDDDGNLLAQPLTATFITSAAPNAGAIARNSPREAVLIPATFQQRAEYVLALAAKHGCTSLVLGAWGCGVFRNDPKVVAQVFADHLRPGQPWAGRFERVLFSVLDTLREQEIFNAFRSALVE